MSILGNVDDCVLALNALAEAGDLNALVFFSNELNDEYAPVAVRCAAASALASCGSAAILELKNTLATEHSFLSKPARHLRWGRSVMTSSACSDGLLAELNSEEGALLALN